MQSRMKNLLSLWCRLEGCVSTLRLCAAAAPPGSRGGRRRRRRRGPPPPGHWRRCKSRPSGRRRRRAAALLVMFTQRGEAARLEFARRLPRPMQRLPHARLLTYPPRDRDAGKQATCTAHVCGARRRAAGEQAVPSGACCSTSGASHRRSSSAPGSSERV